MTRLVDAPPRKLSALIELSLIRELGNQFTQSSGIGLRILDIDGVVLAQFKGESDIWAKLWAISAERPKLTAFIARLKGELGDSKVPTVLYEPVLGFAFMSMRLEYEFESIGQIIIGPYGSAENPPNSYDTLGNEALRHAVSDVALPPSSVAHDVVVGWTSFISKSLEVACHLGYRALLTNELHVDSMAEAYRKLEAANQALEARNAALAANVTRLRELDVLKSNFLATVSHELRTPLTSVIGYSEMLIEGLAGELNEEQLDYVSTIMERGESLLSLIGNILDISRIQRGGVSLNLEYIDPESLIEEALATIRPQAFKQAIELVPLFEPNLPDVQIDGQKILQVLVNLLSNAVKFTDGGGRVTIRIHRRMMPSGGGPSDSPQAAVEISVTDTGIGIAANQLNRIFDAFYQVDNGATRKYGGAGLGLSIVRNVVQAHGGRVQVQSRIGEGTEFVVILPTHQSLKAAEV